MYQEYVMNQDLEEAAVGEWMIRTPQVPGSRPGLYGTFYWASDWLPSKLHHKVESSLVYVEGRGRISQSGLTQDIKMGSFVFQCDVPHQWIAQRQVGPVSVYCDRVVCHVLCILWWDMVSCPVSVHCEGLGYDVLCLYTTVAGWGVMSCVCGMTFLCGSTLVKVPLLQAGTVVIWPQMFKSDVKPKQTNKKSRLLTNVFFLLRFFSHQADFLQLRLLGILAFFDSQLLNASIPLDDKKQVSLHIQCRQNIIYLKCYTLFWKSLRIILYLYTLFQSNTCIGWNCLKGSKVLYLYFFLKHVSSLLTNEHIQKWFAHAFGACISNTFIFKAMSF